MKPNQEPERLLEHDATPGEALPPSGFPRDVPSQTSASIPQAINVVGAGEDGFGESHSRGFSTILFKVLPSETNGGLFVIEHINLARGGPPLHVHLHQDEWFYVMEGEVVFQVGDTRRQLRSGESILAPRNVPHAFASVGETPGRLLIAFTPGGKMEAFLRATAIPNPPRDDAELFRRYDMELLGPPLTV